MNVELEDSDNTRIEQLNLLVVDDDRFTHELLGLFLRDTEFTLISAFNAEEAMKIIVRSAPDIIITDAMMQGESGLSLIDEIKSRPSCARIPILQWTTLTRPDGSALDASGKADILVNNPLYRSNILESLARARQLIAQRSTVSDDVTILIEQSADRVDIIL